MLSNHSYANGVEKWLDLSLQVATNLWLPVYCAPRNSSLNAHLIHVPVSSIFRVD